MRIRATGLQFWQKVTILLASSTILLTIGTAISAWYILDRAASKMEQDSKSVLSDQVESYLEKFVGERAERLDAQLKHAEAIASLGAKHLGENFRNPNRSEVNQFMSSLCSQTNHCSNIYYATVQGIERIFPRENADLLQSDFPNPVNESYFPDVRKFNYGLNEVKWSQAHLNPLYITKDVVVDAVAPVLENGKPLGFIGISLSLMKIISGFNQQQPIRGGYAFLIDTDYRLIGAPPHARVDLAPLQDGSQGIVKISQPANQELGLILRRMVMGETNILKVVIGGDPKYLAYHPLTNINWRLGIVVPTQMATASADKLVAVVNAGSRDVFRGMLFWACVFFIFVMLLSVTLTRQLTKHIGEMSEVAKGMSSGNFEGRVKIRSRDELGTLGRTFNLMADRIQSMIIDLNKVNRELTLKNRALFKENETRKKIEENLRESEEKFRALTENSNDVIMRFDCSHRHLYVNPIVKQVTGIAASDYIGKTHEELGFPDELNKKWKEAIDRVFDQKKENRIEFQLPNKTWLDWVLCPEFSADGEVKAVVTSARDITERKLMEEAMEKSEERYRTLVETMNEGMAVQRDLKLIYVNKSFCDMVGYKKDELIGKDADFLLDDTNREKFRLQMEARQQGINDAYEIELLTKDNKKIYTMVSPNFSGFDGQLYRSSSAIFTDITHRKKTEDELRRLRNYLSNIIDSMPSLLIGIDNNRNITLWNKAAEQSSGKSAESALGKKLSDVYQQISDEIDSVFQKNQPNEIRQERKKLRQTEKGFRYEDITIYPLIDDGIKGAVIRIDDVTGKVQMEEMVVQSEKMLSVGGLAAGMAHEINNPLAAMMQSANVIISRLTDPNMNTNRKIAEQAGVTMNGIKTFMEKREIISMLSSIHESGKRAAKIVTNMLSFARKSDSDYTDHQLQDLLDQSLDLAGSDYNLKKGFDFRQIEILRQYENNVPSVPCEHGKVQQVLLNILRNGAEAMQTRKDEYRKTGDKPRFILRLAHEKREGWVRIEISDNGPGMVETTRKRIFEPFFTTKRLGQGTGLGLSVSYFIITENHGGEMSVQSIKNKGTTFVIRLPLSGRKI